MSWLYPDFSPCARHARHVQREHPTQRGMFADKSPPVPIRELT